MKYGKRVGYITLSFFIDIDMRKIKLRAKTVLYAFAAFLSFVFVIMFFFFGFNKQLYEIGLLRNEPQEPVVIELLHIESFEGGSGSRAEYLRRVAREFNKQNPNKFIGIKTMTIEQLVLNAEFVPDLVSFGVGAGEFLKDRLLFTDLNFDVRSDLLQYGKIQGQTLAVPYMLGGYAVISRSDYLLRTQEEDIFKQNIIVGKRQVSGVGMGMDGFINPVEALRANGISGGGQYVNGTTYEVYESFLNGNFINLIGTQRDVYRLKNREDNGSFVVCEYNYLGGFSDIVQYMGMMKQSVVAEEFIKFVLNAASQKAIGSIGMFSVNTNIYTGGYMQDFENVLGERLSSVNVFLTNAELHKQKQQSFGDM